MEAERRPQEAKRIKGRFVWLTSAQKALEFPHWSDSVVGYCSFDSGDGKVKIPVFSGASDLLPILEMIAKKESTTGEKIWRGKSLSAPVLFHVKRISDEALRIVDIVPDNQNEESEVQTSPTNPQAQGKDRDRNAKGELIELKSEIAELQFHPSILSLKCFDDDGIMATAFLKCNRHISVRYSDLGFLNWADFRCWVRDFLVEDPKKHDKEANRYCPLYVKIQYYLAKNAISTAISKFRFVTFPGQQIIKAENKVTPGDDPAAVTAA